PLSAGEGRYWRRFAASRLVALQPAAFLRYGGSQHVRVGGRGAGADGWRIGSGGEGTPPGIPLGARHSAPPSLPGWRPEPAARSLRDAARVGRCLDLPSPQDALVRALERRVAAGSPLAAGEHALITFDAGQMAWTVAIEGDRMHLLAGRVARPDTVVYAD